MKEKYKSEFLESLHETAVGLHNIGVINGKEMKEYDKDCLVSEPETPFESSSIPVKSTTIYAEASKRS